MCISQTLTQNLQQQQQQQQTMADDNNGAWLGLLKWSLAYTDGTRPSNESLEPMSDEDRKFLESVMKDGIIDEGKRMKAILAELTLALDPLLKNKFSKEEGKTKEMNEFLRKEEDLLELLFELQDIVEQIDYAQAFMTMGGIPFLLGCASESSVVSSSLRQGCLGILATMAQNNPPVQETLLVSENGLSVLGKLFFEESANMNTNTNTNANISRNNDILNADDKGKIRAKILQAISCAIRGHVIGEETFCQNPHLRSILDLGLGAVAIVPSQSDEDVRFTTPPPIALQKKSLFLLRALLTSDTSTRQRVRAFSTALKKVLENVIANNQTRNTFDADIVEMSLTLLVSILRQKHSVNLILDDKNALVARGVSRISELRNLPDGDEKEYTKTELELWETLIVEISRSERDPEESSPTLMISGSPANPASSETLPQ